MNNYLSREMISYLFNVLDDTTKVDGFSIYPSSGNIASGEICIYGYKK